MEIENKGEISFALDTKVQRDANKVLKLSQTAYIERTLREFNIHLSGGRQTPLPIGDITQEDLRRREETDTTTPNSKCGWQALVASSTNTTRHL